MTLDASITADLLDGGMVQQVIGFKDRRSAQPYQDYNDFDAPDFSSRSRVPL